MTIFATCEEQIKLNELVIAQSISICLADVYRYIYQFLFITNYIHRQWGKTTNYWSIDINDRKWVAQTKPSTFYLNSLSWPQFNLDKLITNDIINQCRVDIFWIQSLFLDKPTYSVILRTTMYIHTEYLSINTISPKYFFHWILWYFEFHFLYENHQFLIFKVKNILTHWKLFHHKHMQKQTQNHKGPKKSRSTEISVMILLSSS